ncbi:MAG: hypothetical protein KAW16_00795 [candidate division Zixibacteria bacterium]|nr:hypothetical protein [candidate division Zixibacteria bacterium]
MILRILERDKINYFLPTFTLDVNQIALRDPTTWPSEMNGLAEFEWNYFHLKKVELCVTPETTNEITQQTPISDLAVVAYNRFQKSQLFKSRPPGATLNLTNQDSRKLWTGIRHILWPKVDDPDLTPNQKADVNQVFFHTVASGSLENSAFITIDHNFYDHAAELSSQLGIRILKPFDAWAEYEPTFNLYTPSDQEIKSLWNDQHLLFQRLRDEANK